MCRHLGYLGPPASMAELVYEASHSLCTQAQTPRFQRSGTNNPDGFGFGWYTDDHRPERFRDVRAIWSDPEFVQHARAARSRCFLAAVRLATPGFPVTVDCAQPFLAGSHFFSHNGALENLPAAQDELGHELEALDGYGAPDTCAPVDSAFLFALAVARWRRGMSVADGLADLVHTVADVTGGGMNLLATDGRTLAGTTYGNSLFVRAAGPEGQGTVLASEPCDESPTWQEIPADSVVVADADSITVSSL